MLYVAVCVVPVGAPALSVNRPPVWLRKALAVLNATATCEDSGGVPLRLSLANRFKVPPGLNVAASAMAVITLGTVIVTFTGPLHGVLAGV